MLASWPGTDMDFNTFFSAIIARVEARSGLDTDAPGFVLAMRKPDLRSMLRETFELACRDGEPDETWEGPGQS